MVLKEIKFILTNRYDAYVQYPYSNRVYVQNNATPFNYSSEDLNTCINQMQAACK